MAENHMGFTGEFLFLLINLQGLEVISLLITGNCPIGVTSYKRAFQGEPLLVTNGVMYVITPIDGRK